MMYVCTCRFLFEMFCRLLTKEFVHHVSHSYRRPCLFVENTKSQATTCSSNSVWQICCCVDVTYLVSGSLLTGKMSLVRPALTVQICHHDMTVTGQTSSYSPYLSSRHDRHWTYSPNLSTRHDSLGRPALTVQICHHDLTSKPGWKSWHAYHWVGYQASPLHSKRLPML